MTHSKVPLNLLLCLASSIKAFSLFKGKLCNPWVLIKPNLTIAVLFTISFLHIGCLKAQTTYKNYHIKVAGIKVGHFTTTESFCENGVVTYEVNSTVDINLLVYKMNSKFISKVTYNNGQLQHARVDMKSNKGDYYSETTKTSKGYLVKGEHEDGKFERHIKEPITTSVARLYFHEPKIESQVYAEFYGDLLNLKKIENGVYHGKMPINEDTFYYEKGVLVKSVKKNKIKDLEFIFIDSKTKP